MINSDSLPAPMDLASFTYDEIEAVDILWVREYQFEPRQGYGSNEQAAGSFSVIKNDLFLLTDVICKPTKFAKKIWHA